MCGIAGIVSLDNSLVKKESLDLMLSKIKHRGPDDCGTFIQNNFGLGFVRLSIIDLSPAGHQPMNSADGKYVIIFNGEIFNYLEIKNELEQIGFKFKTNTDTEVLLNAYIAWGKDCLHKLNGMWAFCIFDKIENKLFAARDRFGVKPFYFSQTNNQFLFASEISSILSVREQKPEANMTAIFDYLVFNRTDQNDQTFFKNIFTLKHGHSLFIEGNSFRIEEWYNLRKNLKHPFKTPHEYKNMLIDSVRLRLRSDVPIGVCFSGGLDSSSILSIIINILERQNINTFSAVYKKGETGDETEFIEEYKNIVKNMHFTSPSAKSLYQDMHSFIKTHQEPIPSTSPYAQYKTMELAKTKVTVTLDGQGADEQLGGYHYFFGIYFKELFYKLKWGKLLKEILAYKKQHNSQYALKSFLFFLLPSFIRLKLRAKERGYLNNEFYARYKSTSITSDTIYNSKTLNDALIDHFEYKLEHLLKWEDRNSMHFSIEARVPFLDYRLVERTLSLTPESLLDNGTTKVILRESMKGLLPKKIRLRQDKIGFGTPESEWFRTIEFKNFILELLNSESFNKRGIINRNKAIKLFQKHLNYEIDVSREIWKWINLELWFREFID